MGFLETMGACAKTAAKYMAKLPTREKNEALLCCATAIEAQADFILAENQKDMAANERGAFNDRLMLNTRRVESMAEGLRGVAVLDDPNSETLAMKKLPNGLTVGQIRVPLGVVGMIYEARPNVTVDAFALCFKAGNSCILRGGSEAIRTNIALAEVIQDTLATLGHPREAVQLITDTSRETARAFMRLDRYVDVLIPRGGAGLISSTLENSTIPVIETGVGNCHIFVDESADLAKAEAIVVNAKTQRPSVCNACEKLLVHAKIAPVFLPRVGAALRALGVAIRGDEAVCAALDYAQPASAADWHTEYLALIIGVKVVGDLDEALAHIARYTTGHSEAIITESYSNARRFLDETDAAAVYVNASTRFTDGSEFGLGAEIGISTQKLHARGPMGLAALTTTKYIVYGDGQIRT